MTNDNLSPEEAAARVRVALDRIKRDTPSSQNLVNAFAPLLEEQSKLRAELWPTGRSERNAPQAQNLIDGVPLVEKAAFLSSNDALRAVASRLIPAINEGFPAIGTDLAAIQAALDNGALDAAAMARLLLEDRLEELAGLAENLRIRSAALQFVIGQIIKPLAQDRASRLGLPADDLQWSKGYCPVCGAWPSLSFLFGQEGQRWLKCSFCASEWRYIRTQCPFCENGDLESMEFFFSGDRQWERVEVCHKCKRYVLSLDLRDRVDSVLLEAAPIGMVYLDVLAQEKGFRPGALTEWNVID